jgi:hypothetical protein
MNTPQHEAILMFLQGGGRLTPLKALEQFGCLSLSQRIGELIRAGHPIRSEMIRLSNGKRVAEYRLEEKEHA